MTERCVCGEPAGPHHCLGDPHGPAIGFALEAELQAKQCTECGTADETVMPGGGLCRNCAELSALQAPALERRLRRLATWKAIFRAVFG
jgi:hypothetical protein